MSRFKYFLLAILVIVVGCGTGYTINVDSINKVSSHKPNKYYLIPGSKKIDKSDLHYQEYIKYINKAMAAQGFVKVDNINSAELIVFVNYGIGKPIEKTYSYSIPIIGQTGVSSSTTYGTVNTYGNQSTLNTTTIYTPTYGIVGSSNYVGSATYYTRYLILRAVDASDLLQNKKITEVWKTSAISSGTTGDLRTVMPALVVAVQPHLGTNTKNMIEVLMYTDDSKLLDMKKSVQGTNTK